MKFKDFKEFVDWAAVYVLTKFIESGGPGIRAGIVGVLNAYANWQDEEKAKSKKK